MQILFPTTENFWWVLFSEVKESLCMHKCLIEDQGNWTKHDWHVDKLYSCSNVFQASLLCAKDGFAIKIERSPKIPLNTYFLQSKSSWVEMMITRFRIIFALLQDTWIRVFCIVGLDSATNLLVCGGNHLQWKPSFFILRAFQSVFQDGFASKLKYGTIVILVEEFDLNCSNWCWIVGQANFPRNEEVRRKVAASVGKGELYTKA